MKTVVRMAWLLAALAALPPGFAQQGEKANGVFLVAKPGLPDPNFSETVVLVTQAADSSTVGVIVNRPTTLALREFLPDSPGTENYRDPVFSGGPVMREVLVALFLSEDPPAAPAFHVLRNLYLTMHPDNIQPLLADRVRKYRLYAGFSAWTPGQLESEFKRDGWYVLPADAETVFSSDPQDLWPELVRRAQARPVGTPAGGRLWK